MKILMLTRKLRVDPGRTLFAVLSLALASGVLSARYHVQHALIEPMQRSLVSQGPNIEVIAPPGEEVSQSAAMRLVLGALPAGSRVSAEYLGSGTLSDSPLALRGVDLVRLAMCEPYLPLPVSRDLAGQALVGARLAERLHLRAGNVASVTLENGAAFPLRVERVLQTGGPEEDQALVDLRSLQRSLGTEGRITRLEAVSASSGAELERQAAQIRAALRGSRVRTGRESEVPAAKLLEQWQALLQWATGFVVLAAVLAVIATGLALRDREVAETALLKAVGATDGEVLGTAAVEALALGVSAGLLGGVMGFVLAGWMAHNLGAGAVQWDPRVLGSACVTAIVLSFLTSAWPMVESLVTRPAKLLSR